MTTAEKVIEAWRLRTSKPIRQRGQYWRGPSPLRGDSDSTGFVLHITGDEHGAWKDFVSGRSGSLYTLAREMGVPLPTVTATADTKRGYDSLADYAQAHGVSAEVFEAAGWQETTHNNRPALAYPTANGTRWRFIDGNSPAYINPVGYNGCWYGLRRAVDMATKDKLPLVLCNGEPSTVVAQHYGIPACAITSGEKRLPDSLLAELTTAWAGDVLLCYDCDDTGRRVAGEVQAQLEGSKIVDLAMDNHGDLADFCRLWGKDALGELMRRGKRVKDASVMIHTLVDDYVATLDGSLIMEGKPIIIPFKSWHRMGGFAHIISPGKVMGIMAPSGNGKTAALETMADLLLQRGDGGIYYGPEWSDDEMFARRVQRYGGITLPQLELHRLFMRDVMAGVPDDKNSGILLSPDDLRKSKQLAQKVSQWPGKIEYFRPKLYLEEILDGMSASIEKRRENGELVTFVTFDYVQVLRVRDVTTNDNAYEFALGLIEKFAIDNKVVCIVGSQVTKRATGDVLSGQTLKANQAQYLRDDKFKLLVSFTLQYEDDVYGNKVRTNRAKVDIQKNNMGLTGELRMIADFKHLTWRDESWQ